MFIRAQLCVLSVITAFALVGAPGSGLWADDPSLGGVASKPSAMSAATDALAVPNNFTPQSSQSPYYASIERLDPMDTTGLNPDLITVLSSYYRKSFTSSENWAQIESIRFDGTLTLEQGTLRFSAFKKKPDYCKIVIFTENGGRIVMAYDGVDAWQLNTLMPDPKPESMLPEEALNFIRDATTGGHLLYPLVAEKKIEIVGSANFNGKRHYDILTTLPDGQAIRSLLDMTTFAEVSQTTINNVTGDEEVVTNADFRVIAGVRFPFSSTLTIDGKQIHHSTIEDVQVNLGAMPWMFSPSSGAGMLGHRDSRPRHVAVPSLPELPEGVIPTSTFGAGVDDPWSSKSVFEIDPEAISAGEAREIMQEIEQD